MSICIQAIVSLTNHVGNHFTFYYFCVSQKTKNRNKTYEVEEIESKLQEEQRRNELLQERIDLMKEQLIGSAATDSVAVDVSSILKAMVFFSSFISVLSSSYHAQLIFWGCVQN